MMTRVLDVSRAGYYNWRSRLDVPPAPSTLRGARAVITNDVIECFKAHNGFAGARTIYRDLCKKGIDTTLYAVRMIMREQGLHAKYRRPFKRTTIPAATATHRPDLINRQFEPPVATTHLCGDITYLRTAQGWMYLATVIDLTTRMVVGWQINDRMTTHLIIDALDMAYKAGFVAGNAVFHSDRGSQYTSQQFADFADSINVRLSVGQVGVCWDNAVAESFFSTLKLHLLFDRKQFPSKFDARFETGQWIETYYNRRRIHSATNEIPAIAMAQALKPTVNKTA